MANTLFSDPYTQVYDAIYSLIAESEAIKRACPNLQRNLISLNKGHGIDQIREVVTEGHLPELVLASETVGGNLNIASGASQVIRDYKLSVITPMDTVGKTLYPVEFAITCWLATSNFQDKLRQLKWRGETFIRDVRLGSVESGMADPNKNRGIQGWASIWSFQVTMILSQNLMRAFNNGEVYTGV